MLESGKTIGFNTMQGHIRRIDIWQRALTENEIAQYCSVPPSIDCNGLTDSFDFTNEPFRSSKLNIPVSINDLARFKERITTAPEYIKEPHFVVRNIVKSDPKRILRERQKLDIAKLEKHIDSLCTSKKLGSVENISRVAGYNISDSDLKRMNDILQLNRESKQDYLLDVSHYVDGTDYILLAHYRSCSYAICRIGISEIDECSLRIIELLFTLIAGAISALFGVKPKLSSEAIQYFHSEILSIAAVKAIINKGEVLEAADVYDLFNTLYVHGRLEPLLRIIIELGFWNMIRFLAKATLTFLGGGAASTIASLVATAATFTVKFIEYVTYCIIPPRITLESITFNHDLTRCDTSALNLRKNDTEVVGIPEWRDNGKVNNPIAYAIKQLEDVQIKAKFRMSYNHPTYITIRAKACTGNPLGDLPETTAYFEYGKSKELSFKISLDIGDLTIGCIPSLQWDWEYCAAEANQWKKICITTHKVFFLNDIPTDPWSQNILNEKDWPWSDFLDISSGWLPKEGVKQSECMASVFTEGINKKSGLKYNGSGNFTHINCSNNLCHFYMSHFIKANKMSDKYVEVECSDCAILLQICTTLWKNENLQTVVFLRTNRKEIQTCYLYPIGFDKTNWNTEKWSYHVITTCGARNPDDSNPVFDCCIHLDGSDDPWNGTKAQIPLLPGGYNSRMKLGTLDTRGLTPPYNDITNYLNRLFDNRSQNRTCLDCITVTDIEIQ